MENGFYPGGGVETGVLLFVTKCSETTTHTGTLDIGPQLLLCATIVTMVTWSRAGRPNKENILNRRPLSLSRGGNFHLKGPLPRFSSNKSIILIVRVYPI